MRKYFMTAFVLGAMLVFATSGFALEKTSVRVNPSDTDGWDAAASCSVFYANTCTGWLWVWTGFSPTSQVGVILDPADCCGPGGGVLTATQTRFWTGSPSGYGLTGTLAVHPVVGGCPGPAYQWIPYLAPGGANVVHNWVVPGGPVALTFTLANSAFPDPLSFPTDHPAAGPTGPQACGFCFPSTRTIHSFFFGGSPGGGAPGTLCPGSTLNDGVCDAELLNWGGLFTCTPVSVDQSSWGSVKNLYR